MIVAAFTSLYRAFVRDRLFTLLNLGGLALGIATVLILLLYVQAETDVDRVLPGWQRVWMVQRTLQLPGLGEVATPAPATMLGQLQADYPGTIGARLLFRRATIRDGASATIERVGAVDPDYFAMFPYPAIVGDPTAAIAVPDGAAITARIARAHFGDDAPIGRTLTLVTNGTPRLVRVLAVLQDMPRSTSFPQDIFVALPRTGPIDPMSADGMQTFLSLAPPAAAALRHDFPAFLARHPDPTLAGLPRSAVRQQLRPLAGLHLAAPRDRGVVAALGLVGVLALAVAMLNHLGLSAARAGRRAREVALRTIFGATRAWLVAQFLADAMVAALLAAVVGVALAELALPLVNAAAGTALAIRYAGAGSILPALLPVVLLAGLAAGGVPALLLTRVRPAAVLAGAQGSTATRAGARARRLLVVAQFAVATALMIGTSVLLAQERHLQRSDLGFDRAGLVMLPSFADEGLNAAQRGAITESVARMPGVLASDQSGVAPGGGSFAAGKVRRRGSGAPLLTIVEGEVGPRLLQTYRVHLLAGRLFDPGQFGLDEKRDGKGSNLVLNRTAARQLGFATPDAAIGQALELEGEPASTVIGVVGDIRFASPQEPVGPFLYRQRTHGIGTPVLSIRFAPDEVRTGLERLRALWRRRAPGIPFTGLPVERQLFNSFYAGDAVRARLFLCGAVLAAAVACLGLYGLAASDTARRTREIGIRKALGASSRDVARWLLAGFMRPVLFANLVAWPLAFVALRRWLAGFDDRIALSPLLFLGPTIIALAVAGLTVLGQSWRAAHAAPARALRHE